MDILTAQIDNNKISFYVRDVDRVLNAVEITELPEGPDILLGVINFHGEVLPVLDIRRKFSLPEKEVEPEDKIIILQNQNRRFAVHVDRVLETFSVPDNMIKSLNSSWPELDYKSRIFDTAGDLVIIHEAGDFFLSIDIYELDEIIRKLSGKG
ncbi:MAG TPA: chemotaxis protein CheW [Ignavibacteriales bacterium]|nr:chemotaxis protein CheW [Ignavibacteriales bacterium]